MLLRQRTSNPWPRLEVPIVAIDRWPLLEVNRGCDLPVEHSEQIGVRDAETIEQEFTAGQIGVQVGEPAFALLQDARLGLVRRLGIEQGNEQGLVQLGAGEAQPLLQTRA